MADINLVPAIRTVEAQIREMECEFEKRITPFRDSLVALRKINTACEDCAGSGKVLRTRTCAEDDRPDPNDPKDWYKCSYCNGSGKKPTPVSCAHV